MIPEKLLYNYQVEEVSYDASQIVFSEGRRATNYFQIKTGSVKMFNLTEDGKEFVQGMFYDNESFGEPPLLGKFNYPASAISLEKTILFKLTENQFFKLLTDNVDIHLQITALLAKRLYYKAMIMKEVSVHPPEHRILTLVDFLKKRSNSKGLYQVELTRQQIANLTGLRVETVIRAFKELETSKEVQIINRKIYR